MNKNKKITISLIILVVLIIAFVLLSKFNIISKLKGEATINNEPVIKESKDQCQIIEESDSYVIVNLAINQDYGEKSKALLTFKSDKNTYKKEIEVSVDENNYKYVLPKEKYELIIEKDGYENYNVSIESTKQLQVILHNMSIGPVISTNQIGDNLYYNYYENGLLLVKGYGNMWHAFDADTGDVYLDKYTGNILNDVVYNKLKDNGVTLNKNEKEFLFSISSGVIAGGAIGCQEAEFSTRSYFEDALTELKEDACSESNINMCGDRANVFIYNLGYDKAKKVVDVVLNIPINTNTVITDKITSFEPFSFSFTKIDNLKIPKDYLSYYEGKDISAYEYGSPFTYCKINNLSFDYGIKKIPDYAFSAVKLENNSVVLPGSLTEIGKEAFSDNLLSDINIPSGVEKIGARAFIGNDLTKIKIPSSVIKIDKEAFSFNPISNVTIEGDKTRFNDNWTTIGFPDNLKPSN